MDNQIQFVQKLVIADDKDSLQIALQILMNKENVANQYDCQEKIKITKAYKFFQDYLKLNEKDKNKLLDHIKQQDVKKFLTKVYDKIKFNPMLNNYQLMKIDIQENKIKCETAKQNYIVQLNDQMNVYAKLSYRLEVTISSIWMRKVLRPLILLIFHCRNGQKYSIYLDINQFQEFRRQIAQILRKIHMIEQR